MDDFSDDGFDDVNGELLQELENNALQFTQAQHEPTQPAPQSSAYEYSFGDELDDTVVIDERAGQPSQPAVEEPLPPKPRAAANFPPQQHWSQQARPFGPPDARPIPPRNLPQPSRLLRPQAPAIPHRHSVQPSQSGYLGGPAVDSGAGDHTEILAALQARLSGLERELNSAKGEASILRSKYEKSQTNHEAEVARLKKHNAEQLSKQERIAEAALAAERTAATELQFTRQDLKEEVERAKTKRVTTPKKIDRSRVGGDGFDDIELLPSPSKGRAQRRRDPAPVPFSTAERTPTKGKRKRPVVDSPISALETTEDVVMQDDPVPAKDRKPAAFRPRSLPFDFVRLVLDHSRFRDRPLTFDLLSRYSFPSDPSQSFASIIFRKLPHLGTPTKPISLLIDFAQLLVELWERSLHEKYYSPINDLAALLSFTLQLNTVLVAPQIVSSLVPVAQMTCDLVVRPRFQSVDGDLSGHPDAQLKQLVADVDVAHTLLTLYLVALGCLGPQAHPAGPEVPEALHPQVEFWRLMQVEVVLMTLSPKQRPDDFMAMLSLLCTSVLPQSVGPIMVNNPAGGVSSGPRRSPEFVARNLADRVSALLYDPPSWAAPGSSQYCQVRLALLKTLMAFARSPFGAVQIAASNVVIPRLVTVLCWAVDFLYDMDVPAAFWPAARADRGKDDNGATTAAEGETVQEEQAQTVVVHKESRAPVPETELEPDRTALLQGIIANIVLLLHYLVTDPRTTDLANVLAKTAALHGGAQRYLLTLARLNFADEDLVLEAGIDNSTFELANELLELAATPDESERIGEVFGIVD